MKLSLSSNISRLRKAHGMTQEQLAEALGVTFASVSKWERDVATPELGLIAEMADLFGVSFDVMVGFTVQSGGAAALEERIHVLQREKKYEDAIMEAEKALLRYPNDFKIVYRAGELYAVAGIGQNNKKYLNRCIGLLEHSILLLSQNTDVTISEASIQSEIAQCHIVLGQPKKGVEILKKHNVAGVHSALIAMTYAGTQGLDPKEAEPFMVEAWGMIINTSVRTMMAYGNYYAKSGNYDLSREALCWLIHMLESIKIKKEQAAFTDKMIAVCYAECAVLSQLLGEEEKIRPYLRQAFCVAKVYDAAPTHKMDNIKFCVGDIKKAAVYDDLGESALEAVKNQIKREENGEILYQIWKEMMQEDMYDGGLK